jgi:hypothetical protein
MVTKELVLKYWYHCPKIFDFLDGYEFGIPKHGEWNWLEADGNKSSFVDNHHSLWHHVAESFCQGAFGQDAYGQGNRDMPIPRMDKESGLDPLIHAQCRANMMYVRIALGIFHKDDYK